MACLRTLVYVMPKDCGLCLRTLVYSMPEDFGL